MEHVVISARGKWHVEWCTCLSDECANPVPVSVLTTSLLAQLLSRSSRPGHTIWPELRWLNKTGERYCKSYCISNVYRIIYKLGTLILNKVFLSTSIIAATN